MIFRWSTVFRPFPRTTKTAVAMVDPRPGDNVLFIGAQDPALTGECGAVAGLNGRTVVTDADASAAARIEKAAADAGALVDFVHAPPTAPEVDPNTFNLVVVPEFTAYAPDQRLPVVLAAFRAAAPGARVVLIATLKRGLFSSSKSSGAPTLADVLHLFTRASAVAGRKLAEAEGVTYYEARKPR